ncbi:hypothetical protein ACH4U5_26990 [Streptomyces sp. NPDC020858]|uniref:hypothetical protein n=1 Tax=Streptomyces sp. NPDC020858 TaxID=3365097 RepID=UPI0037988A36
MTTSSESHRGLSLAVLLSCDTLHVIYPATDQLSSAQRAFMINATEIDILPGVRGDLDEPLVSGPASALVPVLLPLVDRGWIEVCRIVPWTAPDGTLGEQPGPPIPTQDLPAVLANAENWEYPQSGTWLGCLTLTLTEAGQRIHR